MEKLLSRLPLASLIAGIWAVANGLLHSIFVLLQHKTGYDRELLRLLMDGHILITCGIFQMIAYKGLQHNQLWGYYASGIAALSLLVYCAMIFPFLRSFGTITINGILLVMLVAGWIKR